MNPVIVYSQPDCPPCTVIKMFLNEHGIPFIEKNIKTDSSARKELTKKYNSYSTPTVIIDGKAYIGFDQEQLQTALHIKG